MAVKGEFKEIDTPICRCFVDSMHRLREEWVAAYRSYTKERIEADMSAPGRPGAANWQQSSLSFSWV